MIGTRHGEKLYETLLTREEMRKAEDMGSYFRVPADNRDLNYNDYFTEGQETLSHEEDYHSHNTQRLDVDGTIETLLTLELRAGGARGLAPARPRGEVPHEDHDGPRHASRDHPPVSRDHSAARSRRRRTCWCTPVRTTTTG